MTPEILQTIVDNSVSLGILAVVLFGVFRLTNRLIDVMSMHVGRFADSLERIADALEEHYNE